MTTRNENEPEEVNIDQIPKLEVHGRGGTSFIQPLETAMKMQPRPDLCIYLTDGDGTAPSVAPSIPVIWCVVPGSYSRKPATWGHTVYCSNDPEELERFFN